MNKSSTYIGTTSPHQLFLIFTHWLPIITDHHPTKSRHLLSSPTVPNIHPLVTNHHQSSPIITQPNLGIFFPHQHFSIFTHWLPIITNHHQAKSRHLLSSSTLFHIHPLVTNHHQAESRHLLSSPIVPHIHPLVTNHHQSSPS